MAREHNRLIRGDCLRELKRLPTGSVHLVFADPPFNIGYAYDEYCDDRSAADYLRWSQDWMTEVVRVLRADGAFWLAIGDEYAAELKVAATRDLGLTCRSWVIWYYTFGVHCESKFTRSHAHLLYFVVDPGQFTFNDEAIRVKSARQLVYGDKRANPAGRVPDDTWIIRPVPEPSWILRPQDLPEGISADSDTWFFPRICGTFKERGGFHGCQMPEQLLGRIILACSHKGDLVLDPFAGTGTTLVAARKLGRHYLGIELSAEYAANARKRVRKAKCGDRLVGSPDPSKTAPSTARGVMLTPDGRRVQRKHLPIRKAARLRRIKGLDGFERGIIEAFGRTHRGLSTDRVVADPEINAAFIQECERLSLAGGAADWNLRLLRLRKASCLSHLRPMKPTRLAPEELDLCEFGSEAAMSVLVEKYRVSLDALLCDPEHATEFDSTARRFAGQRPSLHYRWAALRIRKRRWDIARAGETLDPPLKTFRFGRRRPLRDSSIGTLREGRSVYLLRASDGEPRYVGATDNLRRRMNAHQDAHICENFQLLSHSEFVHRWLDGNRGLRYLYGFQAYHIRRMEPCWNLRGLGLLKPSKQRRRMALNEHGRDARLALVP